MARSKPLDHQGGSRRSFQIAVCVSIRFSWTRMMARISFPLTFDSKGPFCTCVVSPLSFTQTRFLPLCPCLDYSVERFAGDKDWLFNLFLLLLPFLSANRGLVVNSSTGDHLSLASGNAKRRLADCKCPTWNCSISCLSLI